MRTPAGPACNAGTCVTATVLNPMSTAAREPSTSPDLQSRDDRPYPDPHLVPLHQGRGPVACEPKATFSLVHVAHGAAACRPTHPRGATRKRVNVALHERSGDTATRCMSHRTRVRSDMPTRARRTSRAYGATCPRDHVAPDSRADRRSGPCMSLDELVKSDTPARTCRLAHVCSATRIDDNVALPSHPERQGERSLSPHATLRSDMSDRTLVGPRSRGATFSTAYVAALDREARRRSAGMSLHPGG
jgi:hypothetical protein